VGGAPPPRLAAGEDNPLPPTMQPYLHIFSHFLAPVSSAPAKTLLTGHFRGSAPVLRGRPRPATPRAIPTRETALADPYRGGESVAGATIASLALPARTAKGTTPCLKPPHARRDRAGDCTRSASGERAPLRSACALRHSARAPRSRAARCSHASPSRSPAAARAPARAPAPTPPTPFPQRPLSTPAPPCAPAAAKRPTRSPPARRSRTKPIHICDCSARYRRPARRS
jgi:hypothetical protein